MATDHRTLQRQAEHAGSPRVFHLTAADAIRDALIYASEGETFRVTEVLEEALYLLGERP